MGRAENCGAHSEGKCRCLSELDLRSRCGLCDALVCSWCGKEELDWPFINKWIEQQSENRRKTKARSCVVEVLNRVIAGEDPSEILKEWKETK